MATQDSTTTPGCSDSPSLATLSWTTFFNDDSFEILLLVLTRSCSVVSEDTTDSDGLGAWSAIFTFSILPAILTAQLRGPGIIEPESSRPLLGSMLLLARLEHSWLRLTLGCLPLSESAKNKNKEHLGIILRPLSVITPERKCSPSCYALLRLCSRGGAVRENLQIRKQQKAPTHPQKKIIMAPSQ